jgi:Arc/MetJ-type ribon-helix-helix transcriptional regulator
VKAKRAKYTTVSIPSALGIRMKQIIQDSGFKSMSDYATYVLREAVAMHESEKMSQPFDKKETEAIRQRLKALGYI